MFETELVETRRGVFEVFTRLYSEYITNGDIMSQQLSEHYKVHIINLYGAGQPDNQTEQYNYSIAETVHE